MNQTYGRRRSYIVDPASMDLSTSRCLQAGEDLKHQYKCTSQCLDKRKVNSRACIKQQLIKWSPFVKRSLELWWWNHYPNESKHQNQTEEGKWWDWRIFKSLSLFSSDFSSLNSSFVNQNHLFKKRVTIENCTFNEFSIKKKNKRTYDKREESIWWT